MRRGLAWPLDRQRLNFAPREDVSVSVTASRHLESLLRLPFSQICTMASLLKPCHLASMVWFRATSVSPRATVVSVRATSVSSRETDRSTSSCAFSASACVSWPCNDSSSACLAASSFLSEALLPALFLTLASSTAISSCFFSTCVCRVPTFWLAASTSPLESFSCFAFSASSSAYAFSEVSNREISSALDSSPSGRSSSSGFW